MKRICLRVVVSVFRTQPAHLVCLPPTSLSSWMIKVPPLPRSRCFDGFQRSSNESGEARYLQLRQRSDLLSCVNSLSDVLDCSAKIPRFSSDDVQQATLAITLNMHGPSIRVNAFVLGIRLLRWRPRPFIFTAQIIGNRLKLRQLRRLRITADLVDLQMWLLCFIPFHVEQRKRKETTDIKNVLACGFRCLVYQQVDTTVFNTCSL